MHTDVTEAGPFERLMTLQLEESELEDAKNDAARKLSQQLKIKGFRPGKAPRPIVERMVGVDALRSEALEDALPGLVGVALADTDLEPVTPPQIRDMRDGEEGGVTVDVMITLWPAVDAVPDFARKIEVEIPEVSDEELQEQVDRVRSQYAELEDVSRESDEGDFVMINVSATRDGATVEDVDATDLLYEVGSRSYIPGLDEMLVGVSAGAIKEGPGQLPEGFSDHGGEEVQLKVLVKGVKAKKLPELTDDWVSDVSEFETVGELTDQITESLLAMKLNAVQGVYRDKLIDTVLEDLELEIPDALVDAEVESSLHNMAHSLQQQGLDLATYLSVTGQDQQAFVDELKDGARRSLRTRILLEGIARQEGLEVEDEELEEAIVGMAAASGREPDELKTLLSDNGQDNILTGDILRRKALDRMLEVSTPIDADGDPVDLTLEIEEDDADDDVDEAPDDTPAGDQDAGPDADEDA